LEGETKTNYFGHSLTWIISKNWGWSFEFLTFNKITGGKKGGLLAGNYF